MLTWFTRVENSTSHHPLIVNSVDILNGLLLHDNSESDFVNLENEVTYDSACFSINNFIYS